VNKLLPTLGIILWAALHACPIHAQIPSEDLQAMVGPWECADATGVHGFFLNAETQLTKGDGERDVAQQDVGIFVYQRTGADEQRGFFWVGHHDVRGGADLDGTHLMINFAKISFVGLPDPSLSPFNLDLTFDTVAKRWYGPFSLCDEAIAVLEGPHQPAALPPNVFAGNWEGVPTDGASGSLHIRQSVDGKTVAWLDISHSDRRTSRETIFVPQTEKSIVLGIAFGGYDFRYEGTLSSDGKTISGKWLNTSGNGICTTSGLCSTLSAPTVYRHVN